MTGREEAEHLGRRVAAGERVVEAVELGHGASRAEYSEPEQEEYHGGTEDTEQSQSPHRTHGRSSSLYLRGFLPSRRMMARMLRVTSEIGRLRRVLVHEPGPEVDRMVPAMMEELLFDDILFGDGARDEHRRFRRLLQLVGVEVLEARDLLEETLADEPWRATGCWSFSPPEAAARAAIAGSRASSADDLRRGPGRGPAAADLARAASTSADLFELPPLPNWCFQRDPQIVLGDGVVISAMATPARWREGLLARPCSASTRLCAARRVLLDPLASGPRRHSPARPPPAAPRGRRRARAVARRGRGRLVRAHQPRSAIELLAEALARREDGPRWLEIVRAPAAPRLHAPRHGLHPVDRDAGLVFPPGDLRPTAPRQPRSTRSTSTPTTRRRVHRGDLLAALAARGLDLEPIPCGGGDPIAQQREQWTDGANAFALAPGVITLYDRNLATAEELDRARLPASSTPRTCCSAARRSTSTEPGRVCILLPTHEISRARGGPHCLTHPLVRDDLA